MTGAVRLVIAGIAVAMVGAVVWAWQASARASARDQAAFTEAYGWDAGSVSSVGVYAGVAVLTIGVVLAVAGVIAAAVQHK